MRIFFAAIILALLSHTEPTASRGQEEAYDYDPELQVYVGPDAQYELHARRMLCSGDKACLRLYPISDETWQEIESQGYRFGLLAHRGVVGLPWNANLGD